MPRLLRGRAEIARACRGLLKEESLAYGNRMATQPLDTAKVYALTAAGACSVTLTQGEKSITWEALAEGGQTSFIVPAGATAEISDPAALLSPLPANFKPALGAGVTSAGGECISTVSMVGTTATAEMKHATWICLPPETTGCRITPATHDKASSMQMLLTPADDMEDGWLTAQGADIIWPYGEPAVVFGYAYVVTLVQLPVVGSVKIIANLTPLGAI